MVKGRWESELGVTVCRTPPKTLKTQQKRKKLTAGCLPPYPPPHSCGQHNPSTTCCVRRVGCERLRINTAGGQCRCVCASACCCSAKAQHQHHMNPAPSKATIHMSSIFTEPLTSQGPSNSPLQRALVRGVLLLLRLLPVDGAPHLLRQAALLLRRTRHGFIVGLRLVLRSWKVL